MWTCQICTSFLTQPLGISNQASASGILAISPGHGTHTLAALVPQLLWNIDSAGMEPLVKSWQIWLRFFCTGSSQLLLGSCTCWPEFKGKARNIAVVSLLLADEVRTVAENDAAWAPLASTLWGFAAMHCVYTSSGQQLTEIEAQKLSDARSAGLDGYHWLYRDASRRGIFGYVRKPKFHKLDEAVRKAVATRRNPALLWSFSDEG